MFGPRLMSGQVVLRPPVPEDVEARRALGHNAEISRMFGAAVPVTATMTHEAAARWIDRFDQEGVVAWIVEAEASFLGSARLHSFDGRGGARYAVGLLDARRLGRGLGEETTRLVLDHAFGPLGLERIELVTLEINERGRRCFERFGFRTVGRVPDAAVIDGISYDDLLMEVTRSSTSLWS